MKGEGLSPLPSLRYDSPSDTRHDTQVEVRKRPSTLARTPARGVMPTAGYNAAGPLCTHDRRHAHRFTSVAVGLHDTGLRPWPREGDHGILTVVDWGEGTEAGLRAAGVSPLSGRSPPQEDRGV